MMVIWFRLLLGTFFTVTAMLFPQPKLAGRLPSLLPPPMTSNIPGTWAHDTMTRRVIVEILARIIGDNEDELMRPSSPLRSECLLVLNDLKSSLMTGNGGYLRGISDNGPDLNDWDSILTSLSDAERNWLDAPWIISEFYLYRRITEAFRYFETGYDCFAKQKVSGLLEALTPIEDVAARLPLLIKNGQLDVALEIAVHTSLWGNKMDLSLWPAQTSANDASTPTQASDKQPSYRAALEVGRPYILDDQTEAVVSLLSNLPKGEENEIGIVVDNAGYELVSDMMLGHTLLALGVATKVTFHTKAHPTFVSDATNEDCMGTISILKSTKSLHTPELASQWQQHVDEGRFEFVEDVFWCQPTAFWDMPERIQGKIARSKLVFVKGDANYRRLLGERQWELDTPAADVLSYWPVPVCALRTFKGEIGCGVSAEAQARAAAQDSKWLVSGRWGVIQIGGPAH